MAAWIAVHTKSAVCGWTGKLPNALYGAWTKLLEAVKEYGYQGRIPAKDLEDLCGKFGCTWEEWRNVMAASVTKRQPKGMIHEDEDGDIVVVHWSEYQRDPTNADRQRAWRERQKPVTLHNGVTVDIHDSKDSKTDIPEGAKAPPAPRQKKAKTPPNPEVKLFIDWWYTKYRERYGGTYLVAGAKDGDAVKVLLGTYSLADLKRKAEMLLADKMDWPKGPYNIGSLRQHANKLVASVSLEPLSPYTHVDTGVKHG